MLQIKMNIPLQLIVMLPSKRPDARLPPDGQNRLERGWKGLGVERKKGEGAQAKTAFFFLPQLRTEEGGRGRL
jgi:hypothetical protein